MKKKYILSSIVFLLILALSVIPYKNIIDEVYNWHIHQPEFYNAAVGLLLFMVVSFIFISINKNKVTIPLLITSSVFLILNNVFIPVILDIAYFFMILLIGTIFEKESKEEDYYRIIKLFVKGVLTWGSGALILSLFNIGTINELRVYTIVLFAISIIRLLFNNEVKKLFKQLYSGFISIKATNNVNIMIILMMVGMVLCLFAKSNSAFDYDSLWYGLRPEFVLVGNTSFYNNLGFLTYVYYYPKFFELFMLPISNLNDYSFIICENILLYSFSIFVIYKYISKKENNNIFNVLLLANIAVIPAFANIAATAKGDILGFLFIYIAFILFENYKETKKANDIVLSIICLALCTTTRLTCILWGGVLFLCEFVYLIKEAIKNKKIEFKDLKNNIVLMLQAFIITAGVHLRTFFLTGYILYPTGIGIWNKFFSTSKKYFLTSSNTTSTFTLNIKTIVTRLYSVVFNPGNLPHIIMLWTTNFFIVLFILFIINRTKKEKKVRLSIIFLINVIFLLYFLLFMEMPDGNYFIAPIIICSSIIINQTDYSKNNKIIYIALLLHLCTIIPITLVSHPSWAWGIKSYDTISIRANIETINTNKEMFKKYGINKINNRVKKYRVTDKVISSTEWAGLYFRLECNLETYEQLSNNHFADANIVDYDSFKEVIEYLNVKAIILDNSDETDFRNYVIKYVAEKQPKKIIKDKSAVCYEMR